MKKNILVLVSVFIINLNAQVWEVVNEAGMPFPVYGGEAVVVDSLIYILGGYSDSLNVNINVIQEYNPQTNTWRIIDSLKSPRYGFISGNYQDSIVVIGGIDLNLLLDSSLEIYNLNNTPYVFDLKPEFIRTFATGLIRNNILYVFGGFSVSLLSTYMFEYNISDTSFIFSDNFGFLTYPYQQMSAFAGNSIFLFGGVFIATSRVIYKYDIQNHSLDIIQIQLNQARTGGRAVSFNDSTIYIIGGFNESSLSLSSVEVFNLNGGNFEVVNGPALNFERTELMAVSYNNSIYVFGGKDDSGDPVRQTEKLNFSTNVLNETTENLSDFILFPNYPNPFNPATNINFHVPSRSNVVIKVFNAAGEEVSELINEEMETGNYNILFDASKEYINLASGVYFYQVAIFNFSTQKSYIATRKMLLLK